MLVVPFLVDNEAIGVIDVRAPIAAGLPRFAESLLKTLSQILGAQLSQVRASDKQAKAERERFELELKTIRERFIREKAMQDAFEDVSHQIKSPLTEASRRLRDLAASNSNAHLDRDLYDLAGLLKRAELTAKLIGLFAAFARGESGLVRGVPIQAVTLVKMLGEIVSNQRPKLDSEKGIRFDFDAGSIYRLAPADLEGDPDLLYQALSNLLDNAIKYSSSHTVIVMRGGLRKTGRFFLSVRNKGLPISPTETISFKRRNTRGTFAKQVTGEGNGLGLFIVDKIMQAHGGELQLLPTDSKGMNDCRLIFHP